MGLSSPDSGEPQGWQGWPSVPGYYNLHAQVGRDLEDAHLKMVEMRDDQGRELQFTGTSARRLGSTPVAWIEHGWALDIPKDAKTLDVTFAFSKSVQVEFLAKPVMAGQAHEAK